MYVRFNTVYRMYWKKRRDGYRREARSQWRYIRSKEISQLDHGQIAVGNKYRTSVRIFRSDAQNPKNGTVLAVFLLSSGENADHVGQITTIHS